MILGRRAPLPTGRIPEGAACRGRGGAAYNGSMNQGPRNEPTIAPGEGVEREVIPLARPIEWDAESMAGEVRDGGAPPSRGSRASLLLNDQKAAHTWRDLFLVGGALVAFELATVVVVELWMGPMEPGTESFATMKQSWLFPVLGLRAVAVVMILATLLRVRGQSWATLGWTRERLGADLTLGLAALAAAYVLIFAWALLSMSLWPGLMDQMNENAHHLMTLLPDWPFSLYVLVAALIGFYEELLFRGFLMTRLRRVTGSWVLAVVLSTLVFTGLHAGDQKAAAMVPITILSLVFSVFTVWRGSVFPAMVGHFLFDLSQFIGLKFWQE